MSRLEIVPCTIKSAKEFVSGLHRHNKPPQGALFAIGLCCDGVVCGVAIIGRPIARNLDDGKTCEVTRLCTNGQPNACSKLYGAAARAAKELGWKRIVTYILDTEPGTSLKASGWVKEKDVKSEATWSRPSRERGNAGRPVCAKTRWGKKL